ncbi:SPRY-domain-containing protein [Rhizophagus irregularis]|uniref:SPRY-domain-containing protein n=1 Tax=Rhizophagus irregularis TaxID=588596 RepID=A0A2I1GER7_9GLOM|nr:SPRY-domain-containing protein [Rhizophagus irregularis]
MNLTTNLFLILLLLPFFNDNSLVTGQVKDSGSKQNGNTRYLAGLLTLLLSLIICFCCCRHRRYTIIGNNIIPVRSSPVNTYTMDTRANASSNLSQSNQPHHFSQPIQPPPPYTVINITSRNGPSPAEIREAAEKFTRDNPPKDDLPSLEQIANIRTLGGVKAWQFISQDNSYRSKIVSVTNDGKTIKFLKNLDCNIQTNYPYFVPIIEGDNNLNNLKDVRILHYFEITIIENNDPYNTDIAIGLTTKPYPEFRLPGLNLYSVGYHSVNGKKYNDNDIGIDYGPNWTEVGITIGCGYDSNNGNVFFTKNGQFLGNAFTNLKHIWFPTIGAKGLCTIEINFGDNEFLYKDARGYNPSGLNANSNQ